VLRARVRLVLDTNTAVAALLWRGPPREHDRAIGAILSAIRELMQSKVAVPKRRPIGFACVGRAFCGLAARIDASASARA